MKKCQLLLFAILLVFVQCADSASKGKDSGESGVDTTSAQQGSNENGQSASELAATSLPENIAGYYEGTMPCADCEGIQLQLSLGPDSAYILLETYLGKSKLPYATFGDWSVRSGKVMLADRRNGALQFRPDKSKLQLLDENEQSAASGLPYELQLQDKGIDLSQNVRVKGAYRYYADAATFTPCGTDKKYPVLSSSGSLNAERAYLSKEREALEPMYVDMEISIKTAPNQEGKQREQAVIKKFHNSLPGNPCADGKN